MTAAAKLLLLRRWHEAYKQASKAWDAAKPVFGSDPTGSPLWDAQWAVFDALTQATAAATGYDEDTLDWWLYQCKAGKEANQAGLKDGPQRHIKSLKDLQWLCELAKPVVPEAVRLLRLLDRYGRVTWNFDEQQADPGTG